MSGSERTPVVVGVDGSPESRAAVRYAAWAADQRYVPLRLVHGLQYPPAYGYAVMSDSYIRFIAEDAQGLVRDTEVAVAREFPGLPVIRRVAVGGPANILIEESKAASLVVVGSRGRGGFAHLLTGSVSSQLATHGHCPVVVARLTEGADPATMPVPAAGPVVVGVDGSPGTDAVVAFAIEEAAAREVPLIAVYVWADDPSPAQHIEQVLAGWAEKYPDVATTLHAVPGAHPAPVLLEQASGAGLLVVGHRPHGALVSALLGSVSHAVLGPARCAVAVVRP